MDTHQGRSRPRPRPTFPGAGPPRIVKLSQDVARALVGFNDLLLVLPYQVDEDGIRIELPKSEGPRIWIGEPTLGIHQPDGINEQIPRESPTSFPVVGECQKPLASARAIETRHPRSSSTLMSQLRRESSVVARQSTPRALRDDEEVYW